MIVLLGLGYLLMIVSVLPLVRESNTIDKYQRDIEEYLSNDWF